MTDRLSLRSRFLPPAGGGQEGVLPDVACKRPSPQPSPARGRGSLQEDDARVSTSQVRPHYLPPQGGGQEGAHSPERVSRARYLRKHMTEAERILWGMLRRKATGCRFRRQHPLGPYILDFVCFSPRLVVEVDGGQHAESGRDVIRDSFLAEQGYRVLRFWNNEVLSNIGGVLVVIMKALAAPSPQPSPACGRGSLAWRTRLP
ncbi:MAG: endonuclease domain-containing protein [Acidobacteriia bacterium]|nr:endonuclease domain-containing protein [Terriglobia bacterium]